MTSKEEAGGIVARPYQLRLLEHAIQHNAIIYLPTGSGKTYIAIMLIRHFSKELNKPIQEGGKRCAFLCNTVELARQNCREIAVATNLKVGLFIGDMNVDNWPSERWETEVNANQVFVGTSQVFVDMVSHNYLSVTDLSCVIIDECHHATKSHPMHTFLSHFLHADRAKLPRAVGLTGVLLKSMKKGDILKSLVDLEAAFRGKIITVENFDEFHNVLLYSTAPNEIMISYTDETQAFGVESQVNAIISACISQIEVFDFGGKSKLSKNLATIREPNKLKQVKSLLQDFQYQMDDMGLYAASIAIMALIVQFEVNKRNAETIALRDMYRFVISRCEHIRHIIVKKMKSYFDEDDEDTNETDIIINFSKPKLQKLLAYFLKEFTPKKGTDISCLLFVTRRYTAKCLYFVIKNFAEAHKGLSHIVPEFMVGRCTGMNYTLDTVLDSKWNRCAVERFRRKECNLIVCSSVLEEGIDVQACNYVISFDEIKQFSSYVQMKGRARARNSTYAVVCKKEAQLEVAQKIQSYRKTDEILKNYLITRSIDREIPDESRVMEEFAHVIEPFITTKGAILKPESTLMLMHRYCQSLPHDSFTQSTALWKVISGVPGTCQVSLELPIQSTVKDVITSDVMQTIKLAKISAAFKACILLYKCGELTENLLPVTQKHVVENVSDLYFAKWKNEADDNLLLEVGTKKNTRVYEKSYPDELTAALPFPGEVAYGYCINIEPEFVHDEYNAHIQHLLKSEATFAIVLRHKLPALAPMPLFMSQGPLTVQIDSKPFEFVLSDGEELKKLKVFNKMLFSDVRGLWKDFLAIDNGKGPNSFLLAPVKSKCGIDWAVVHSCQQLTPSRRLTEQERQRKTFSAEEFLGKIVNTWYSYDDKVRYVVTKIRNDLTPLSAFPTTDKSIKTFADYVEVKYGEKVVHNNQFMLEVQAITSRTNFFVNAAGKTSESKRAKRDNTVLLIPEMCHNYRFPGDLWLKALLLPSILHRFHFLLNAEKLRVDINSYLGIVTAPDYKPAPIQIDESLRRTSSDNKEPRSMLPALETTREDKSSNHVFTLVDIEQGSWKSYLEPIDVYRNVNSLHQIEVDYYHQFVNNLLTEMENLKMDDLTANEVTNHQLKAHKPKVEAQYETLARKLTDISFDSGRHINILEENVSPTAIRTAEQFEFLSAITTAATNDVFDMERFEVLGDSFLKFSVSLLLMHQHQKWNEGLLTTVKSRMVSNRNLLYCMRAKYKKSFICSSIFEPTSEWLPPCANVPANIFEAIRSGGIPANCLYQLTMSDEEIISGQCNESTMETISACCGEFSETSTDCLNEFLHKQAIADKVVADCLEALLGVCVKNYGVQKSFEMLGYFGIFYDDEKHLLPRLLNINLGNPLVKTNAKQSDVDAYLINYEFLEANLQYNFKERAYLLQALTHPSYPTNRLTGCYQQLEFIGDAVLDFLMSCYIYERCKHMNPGDITDLRSALVNNITLACVGVRNRFHQFMLYESPSLADSIRKFAEFQDTQDHRVTDQVKILLEENANPEAFNMAQNIDVPKALGDVLEALIGAVFLDSGNDLRCTWRVISHLMDTELNDFIQEVPIDPVRQLYECKGANPHFELGPVDTDVVMLKCTFYCRDTLKTVIGCGINKSTAKKAAAKMALQILHAN